MSNKLIEKAKTLLSAERRTLLAGKQPAFNDRKGKLSIALAYPHRYYTAMSNLGFQTVYRLFNEQPDTLCQRVFLPDAEDFEEYRRTETPLFSLESQWPVHTFDVLAFSISYENDYPHLLQMMELARIPLLKKDRKEAEPLVMAGGATLLMNPEPLADFVDFFVIGEAEVVAAPLTETLRRWKEAGEAKEKLLAELATMEGVYVPQFYTISYKPDGTIESFVPQGAFPDRVKRVWLKDLNDSLTISPLVTPNTELSQMLLVELSRGCRRGCRFCASCYTYFPHRVRDGPLLKEAALKGSSPAEKIGLVGAAISDYPELISFGQEILHSQKPLSFSSLRVDSLTPEMADLILESGQKTITLAPEAGSERMRRVVRKGFTEEEIIRAAEILADRGVSSLRLYFMIGLPMERAEDVKAIIDLTKKIRHHLLKKSRGKKGTERIHLSLNSFVPKPATPFQWHPFEDVRSLQDKIRAVRKGLQKERGVSVAADVPKWAYLQSLLSRGDRRVGRLLLTNHHLGGNWPQAYRSVDVNPDFYVYRRRTFAEILPWDFIDHGIKKEFLWSEYQEALKEGSEDSKVQGF
ncbi:MAG: TIGR03960 family B12-binding radical SAM protein [Thermodesulfobacteriota bacterium]|jgi:radical SAM family uncharacterized protein